MRTRSRQSSARRTQQGSCCCSQVLPVLSRGLYTQYQPPQRNCHSPHGQYDEEKRPHTTVADIIARTQHIVTHTLHTTSSSRRCTSRRRTRCTASTPVPPSTCSLGSSMHNSTIRSQTLDLIHMKQRYQDIKHRTSSGATLPPPPHVPSTRQERQHRRYHHIPPYPMDMPHTLCQQCGDSEDTSQERTLPARTRTNDSFPH